MVQTPPRQLPPPLEISHDTYPWIPLELEARRESLVARRCITLHQGSSRMARRPWFALARRDYPPSTTCTPGNPKTIKTLGSPARKPGASTLDSPGGVQGRLYFHIPCSSPSVHYASGLVARLEPNPNYMTCSSTHRESHGYARTHARLQVISTLELTYL